MAGEGAPGSGERAPVSTWPGRGDVPAGGPMGLVLAAGGAEGRPGAMTAAGGCTWGVDCDAGAADGGSAIAGGGAGRAGAGGAAGLGVPGATMGG